MKHIRLLFSLLLLMYQPLSINATNPVGYFQPVPGSPFAAGSGPAWFTYSPVVSGNLFAAVPNYYDANITVYEVDQTTGALTQIASSPISSGANPATIAYSPLVEGNLFAGVPNANDNNISVYLVNQTSGAFTQVAGSPFPAGSGPYGLAFTLAAGNLFAGVPNSGDASIAIYEVNQSNGALAQVVGSPFASGSGPYGFAFSPIASGNIFAACVNQNDNTSRIVKFKRT